MIAGEYTYGTEYINVLWGGEGRKLKIGDFCSIALNYLVYLIVNHNNHWIITYPFTRLNHINKNLTTI